MLTPSVLYQIYHSWSWFKIWNRSLKKDAMPCTLPERGLERVKGDCRMACLYLPTWERGESTQGVAVLSWKALESPISHFLSSFFFSFFFLQRSTRQRSTTNCHPCVTDSPDWSAVVLQHWTLGAILLWLWPVLRPHGFPHDVLRREIQPHQCQVVLRLPTVADMQWLPPVVVFPDDHVNQAT